MATTGQPPQPPTTTPTPTPPLDELLFQAARTNVAIRREYARLRGVDSGGEAVGGGAKHFVYVLLLSSGMFYVGSTDNVYQRLLEHVVMSPSSSLWVREHGPVRRIVEVCRNCGPNDETLKTLEYMMLFGWENVRGSHWCRVALDAPPRPLAGFQRGAAEFEYLSMEEMAVLRARVESLARDWRAEA
jgi:hypothetical protein